MQPIPTLPKDRKALIGLFKAIENILSIQDLDSLLAEVMDISIDILEAERGMIFLQDPTSKTLEFHFGRNVDHQSIKEAGQYSARLVQEAGERDLVVVEDVQQDDSISAYESIVRYDIRSVLCAPLRISGAVQGVIYLDSRNRTLEVDEAQKAILVAFSNLAAQVIENSRILASAVTDRERLTEENRSLRTRVDQVLGPGAIVGESSSIQRVLETVAKVAPRPSNILIEGESGTGKELVARALHELSDRSDKPFVAISCPSIPRELIESEFFGHERGSFTGATQRKIGKFELADGGTLFLDEIGDMEPATQTKVLRAIQERSFMRVGGTRTIHVDVRIVSATSRELEVEVGEGRFREDLYYRLCVVPIRMPPLRDRDGDTPLLAAHFIEKYNRIFGRSVEGLDPSASAALASFGWPGNVRQLENAIEYAMNVAGGDHITSEDLPFFIRPTETPAGAVVTEVRDFDRQVESLESTLIGRAMEQSGQNQSEAARLLGITESRIRAKIRKYNL